MHASLRGVSKGKLCLASAMGALAALALAGTAWTAEGPKSDEVFKATTAIQVGTTPFVSFDISWVDSTLHRYFLADRSHKSIDVVNPSDNSITLFPNPGYAGAIPGNNDVSGPDGVLTANNHTELWVGDSPGRVWVLDSSNGAIKTPAQGVPANPILVNADPITHANLSTTRADELCYDPHNHVIMIASPAETPPFVTFIDTTSHTVISKLNFDGTNGTPNATGGLEQCQWSPKTGKLYQNVPVDGAGPGGAVVVIDGKTMKVENIFPVPPEACELPQGMTIGPSNQILLGCAGVSPNGHSNIAIINANSGAILASLPDIGGADQVWFNEGDGHYFIPGCNAACRANPGSQLEQLGVVDANGFRLDQSVPIPANAGTTGRRVHSVAADDATNQVYVPIPAITGTFSTPSICSSATHNVGSPSDATGCIAVFTATHDDRSRVAHERDRDDHQE